MNAPTVAQLMLLDTYGLVYRAFFALPALTTTQGVPINAAYGFTMMLTKIIADEQPTHVIAAFDKGLPAARVAMYPQYKAQRDEMPDDLRSQFALVRRILDAYGIPIVRDRRRRSRRRDRDARARKAEAQAQPTLIVTGDLDLLQIVDERTTVLTRGAASRELGALRSGRGARALRSRARAIARLSRAQGRSVRQSARHPRRRREDGDQADQERPVRSMRCSPNPALAGTPKLENLDPRVRRSRRVMCRDVSIIERDLPLDARLGARALHAAVERRALSALSRSRIQDAARPSSRRRERRAARRRLDTTRSTARTRSFVGRDRSAGFRAARAMLRELAARARHVALARAATELGVAAADGKASRSWPARSRSRGRARAFDALCDAAELVAARCARRCTRAARARHRAARGRRRHDDRRAPARSRRARSRKLADVASEFSSTRCPTMPAAARRRGAAPRAGVARASWRSASNSALYDDVELPLARCSRRWNAPASRSIPRELDELCAGRRRGGRAAAERDLRARRRDVQHRLAAAARHDPVREAAASRGGTQNKTGWATGSRSAAGARARVSDLREGARVPRGHQAQEHLHRRAAEAGRRATAACTRCFNQTSTATGRLSSTNPNLQNIPVRSELGPADPPRVRRAGPRPRAARRRLQSDRTAPDGASLGRRSDARGVPRRPGHPRLHRAPDLRRRRPDRRRRPISAASRSRSTSACSTACRISASRSAWRSRAPKRAR